VSILNRLRLNNHLDDAALAAVWTDHSLTGRSAHPHLQRCPDCRARFAEFSAWLEDVRFDAIAEADDAFPPERLATQHAQILRRLEASGRPARVIAFPKFAQPLAAGSSHASRWIAAAAAAGLIVGVGVGQWMDLRHSVAGSQAPSSQVGVTAPPRPDRPLVIQTARATEGDEAFLSEVDATLARRSVPELRALDEFTPRAGERPR
jgi:hypothetical protein